MAGFLKGIMNKVTGYDGDDEYENEYDEYYEEDNTTQGYPYASLPEREPVMTYTAPQESYRGPERYDSPSKVVPLKQSAGEHQIVFMNPDNIRSAQNVCDQLRAGNTVICNILDGVDPHQAQRVIDYISGAAHALDGNVKPISKNANSFIAAPKNISIVEKKANEKFAPQDYSSAYRNNFG